jgi:hypothetical protein
MLPSSKTRPRGRDGNGHVGRCTRVMVGDRQYRVWLDSEHVEVSTVSGSWRKVSSRRIATIALLRASDAAHAECTCAAKDMTFGRCCKASNG